MADADPPTAGPATCATCHAHPPKYTCPRCALRTCSAACSRAHKAATQCSGERDKAAFVPLNAYTYGKLMDDYTWLESGKRRVEAWSRGAGEGGAGGGEGAPAGALGKEGSSRKAKAQILQRELERRGIEMEMLPEGMHRRTKNQSTFNTKSKLVQLSVDLVVRSGGDAATSPTDTPHATTHFIPRVPLQPSTTLASLLAHLPSSSTPPPDPLILIPVTLPAHLPLPSSVPPSTPGQRPRTRRIFYPHLPDDTALETALSGTGFLEFPTLEMWSNPEWERALARGEVGAVPIPSASGEDEEEKEEGEEVVVAGEKRVRDAGWGKRRGGIGGAAEADGNAAKRSRTNGDGIGEEQGEVSRDSTAPSAAWAQRTTQPAQTLSSLMGAYGSDSDSGSEAGTELDEGANGAGETQGTAGGLEKGALAGAAVGEEQSAGRSF